MKVLIKVLIIISVSVFSVMPSTVNAQNQEHSDYYYQGYTFKETNGVKSASPYLTVVMIEGEDEQPKAVSMSSAIGDISLEGTPIDIYKQNKLEVYAGNELIGVYLPKQWTEKPPFPNGNMNIHMEIPANIDFYTVKELDLPTERNISLREFLKTMPDIEMDEDNFFGKESNAGLRIFINNSNLTESKLKSLLDNLTVNYIKNCQLVLYNEPNKYFSGAINITLVAGNPGSFPSDTQYINSLPLSR
ncbi:MAG: hypothetical protein SOZ80_00945 [Prevotella sp.]|uniref:hypothetical protein n=1 Tax=Prevotella sp. TaxID=59823 RepID=UPI002A30FAE6|nr:hypothetical protein [Prevotella sp.]MDD7318709.1 hypothetical protein [Prevotellaceae bacterium]MDY4019334.1 hypothetical protein [Prevotella sp.]